MRLVAALAVLVSHSFSVATGRTADEPLRALIGLSLGELGLDTFLVLSGYLVTRSARARSTGEFFLARFRRVYPAAATSTIITVAIAALAFSEVSLKEFVSDPLAGWHLAKNVVLILGPAYGLPGTFLDNPYAGVVNGSLWTISVELQLYTVLGCIAVAFRMTRMSEAAWRASSIVLVLFGAVCAVWPGLDALSHATARVVFMFAAGSCLQAFAYHGGRRAWLLILPLLAAAAATRNAFFAIYLTSMPILVIWMAYARPRFTRASERASDARADYSFGIYLYGFPVQQGVAAVLPGAGWEMILVTAAPVIVVLAAASWHFIERPALARSMWRGRSITRRCRSPE